MKYKLSVLFIILTFFILTKTVVAESLQPNFNNSCIFSPKIIPISINISLYGTGNFYHELVENNKAEYLLKITTSGNWSSYQSMIEHRTLVQCDGELAYLGTSFGVKSYKIFNGNVMSDFIDKNEFLIPENKKHCQVILVGVYAINHSWVEESGCTFGRRDGKDNCLCKVTGLSGIYDGVLDEKDVLTVDQFFSKKNIETAKEISKENTNAARFDVMLGAILGFITVILGAVIAYFFQKSILNNTWKREHIRDIYAPLMSELNRTIIPSLKSFHLSDLSVWKDITSNNLEIWIDKKLRVKLNNLFDKSYPNFKNSVQILSRKLSEEIGTEIKKHATIKDDFLVDGKGNKQYISTFAPFNYFVNNPHRGRNILIGKIESLEKIDINKNYDIIKLFIKHRFASGEEFIEYMIKNTKYKNDIKSIHAQQSKILEETNTLIKILEKIIDN